MLDEYRELCREKASIIPNWKNIPKNDLFRQYIEHEDDQYLRDAYYCAIMYKYWPAIQHYHYACNQLAPPEECYNWLVRAVTYTLKHRRWEDPTSSIYQDPDGPDKMVNRSLKSARLTYYQYLNRYKRKEDFGLLSYEQLKEDYDTVNFDLVDEHNNVNINTLDLAQYIKRIFYKKDYFLAFMLDAILNEDCFSTTKDGYSKIEYKKLKKRLRHIDDRQAQIFAERYNIPIEEVRNSLKYLPCSPNKLNQKIEANILNLRHDEFIIQLNKGGV